MKITATEAIKQQEDALADKWCPWGSELKASIRLGIEALKRLQANRHLDDTVDVSPLPGEAKE